MMNNILENTLKETWEIKNDFYEKNKNYSLKEIIQNIENKKYNIQEANVHIVHGSSHNNR